MKTGFWVLLALLMGMVLGGLGPKADLRQVREELSQLRKQQPRRTGDRLTGITAMLRIPDAEPPTEPRRRGPPRPVAVTETPLDEAAGPAATSNTRPMRVESDVSESEPDRATLKHRIEQAADLWKMRVDLARNGFVANVASKPELATLFDALIADMNARLAANIRTWVDYLKTQPDFTPETGIRMMNALSTDLVQTYEDLDATMPAGWRTQAGADFQLFDFIDPQVALPLTEVEETLNVSDGPRTGERAHALERE